MVERFIDDFLTFIDDFSRKTWVYFLKEKEEAFDAFKQLLAMAEKQSGYYIKVLRSDRGGEYTSRAFQEFCKENGIKHQLTAAYTPQQNGVSERKNRTILDMARSMLKGKHMPTSFWAEAVACAVYLLNRCPTKSVRFKTPLEVWNGHKPGVSHLKVFGCIAYAHVPDQKRTKLEDKGEKCIFIGYDNRTKAYKLYNPESHKVIISRDVEFDEEDYWKWSDEEKSIKGRFFEDENSEEQDKETQTPPLSPVPSPPSSPSSASSSDNSPDSDSRGAQRKMRSLREIYEQTEGNN